MGCEQKRNQERRVDFILFLKQLKKVDSEEEQELDGNPIQDFFFVIEKNFNVYF